LLALVNMLEKANTGSHIYINENLKKMYKGSNEA